MGDAGMNDQHIATPDPAHIHFPAARLTGKQRPVRLHQMLGAPAGDDCDLGAFMIVKKTRRMFAARRQADIDRQFARLDIIGEIPVIFGTHDRSPPAFGPNIL